MKHPKLQPMEGVVLFVTGFVGVCVDAHNFVNVITDICSFSVITLLFRVSEKVATPTSVVLMGLNTCVGFYWRQLIMSDVSQLAWEYFAVSVPVVVICAPLGSLLGSHFHRLVLAGFIYVLEIAAVVGFLCTRPDPILVVVGIIIVCVSFVFFLGISRLGKYLHEDRLQHPSNRLLLNGKKQSHMIGPMIEGPIKGSNSKNKMKESELV
uniref:Magnesium transporter n=1 Tax=Ditylenchus dipsaci TaxID=166011 RepID=A0A915D6P6_9BILA